MLDQDVIIKLFEAHCCSFYGSHLWKSNSSGFDKTCTSWNVAIRILFYLFYNTHTGIFGLLITVSDSYKKSILCA